MDWLVMKYRCFSLNHLNLVQSLYSWFVIISHSILFSDWSHARTHTPTHTHTHRERVREREREIIILKRQLHIYKLFFIPFHTYSCYLISYFHHLLMNWQHYIIQKLQAFSGSYLEIISILRVKDARCIELLVLSAIICLIIE